MDDRSQAALAWMLVGIAVQAQLPNKAEETPEEWMPWNYAGTLAGLGLLGYDRVVRRAQ